MSISVILAVLLQVAAFENINPACGGNVQAQQLAALIMGHESQQRTELQCNGLLSEIAAQRAAELGSGKKSDDLTPNEILTGNGFRFPSFYPRIGNQVEALASEYDTPESAAEYLFRSFEHRDLIMGDGEFFSRQSQIGVGYYENEDKLTQYVVLIAEPYSKPKIVVKHDFKPPKTSSQIKCGKTWRSSSNAEHRKICRERWEKEKKDRE